MPDRNRIPEEYYSAKEAREVLKLDEYTFQNWVRAGRIPRTILPRMRQGVYAKRDVDALALAIEDTISEKDMVFSKSTPGDQLEEMFLGIRCFGEEFITPFKERVEFQQKSEFTFYSLKLRNHVVGYISMFHFPPDFLDDILTGRKVEHEITLKEVLKFPLHEPFDIYIDVLAVEPSLPWRERRLCTKRIVEEFANLILHLLDNGYEIRTIYTVSATRNGDNLIRSHFHFMEGKSLKTGRKAYMFSIDEQATRHLRELTGRFHDSDTEN